LEFLPQRYPKYQDFYELRSANMLVLEEREFQNVFGLQNHEELVRVDCLPGNPKIGF
jgi:hypothetical protein